MNLSWLISGKLVNENGVWTSDMASNRYRVLMPANKLAEQGHTINIIHDCTNIIASGGSELSDVDILIIAKSFDQDHLTVAKQAKSLGKKIIIDVCDNYFFQNAEMLAHYSALIELSNVVVANSQGMADSLAQRFKNKKIIVIEDPYESIKQPAVFSPSDKELRLAWFGYDRNLPVLLDEIPNLGKVSESIPIKLKIVTNKNDSLAKDVAAFNQEFAGQFNIEYILWSREATQQAILDSDIVLIPNKTVDDGLVKSSNRIIESIMMGRFVCASPIPSYKEFEQWAYVGDNLVEGIVWALNNPHEVTEKISQAQTYIESHYSPACIGDKWNQLLQEMTSAAQAVYTTSADDYVKLNLGCGDKILPGYVNVDVVPARAGNQPDVICDLHDLSVFENNSADEILSVHVIEHFWRWEVEDVLKEWIRVLKPGGKMIIECPNLKSACEEFLRNPEAAATGGPEGQRSMWVFYGDPAWKDPLMVHRWGYTPESLASLLASVGLSNVRQEAAEFKLREPRDMRIVAEKPRL